MSELALSAELNRLRWRCRRGTRELDQLFDWWLRERYPVADGDARSAFSDLLDQQDPDLWDWVMGKGEPAEPGQAAIIREIRTLHRV